MSSFRAFGKDSAARVATTPVPTAAEIIGSYRPAHPLGGRATRRLGRFTPGMGAGSSLSAQKSTGQTPLAG